MFMFGNLEKNKFAFLLDIGGAWWAAAKVGFYAHGFVFKLGYSLVGLPEMGYGEQPLAQPTAQAHLISLEFGYKFNWKMLE